MFQLFPRTSCNWDFPIINPFAVVNQAILWSPQIGILWGNLVIAPFKQRKKEITFCESLFGNHGSYPGKVRGWNSCIETLVWLLSLFQSHRTWCSIRSQENLVYIPSIYWERKRNTGFWCLLRRGQIVLMEYSTLNQHLAWNRWILFSNSWKRVTRYHTEFYLHLVILWVTYSARM